MPGLAATHRVIAFDLKGYGKSDKPRGGYDLSTLSREMRDALHALGYERAVWAGHDWGGVLLWAIVLRYPEIVERFVIIDAPLHRVNPVRSSYVLVFNIPGLMDWVLARYNDRFIRRMRGASYKPDALTDEALAEYSRAFALPGVHRASLAYYRSIWKSAIQRFLWVRRKVRRPCLIIWALHDPTLPVSVLKGIERFFAVPFTIEPIPQCGHWVMEEQPARTLQLMQSFIGGE